MVFIGPVFPYTTKICLKRVAHCGEVRGKRNRSICRGHELANALFKIKTLSLLVPVCITIDTLFINKLF